MTISGTVLIVDDEAILRRTLTRILRQAGCQVMAAADGGEALQLLATSPCDLVFLDIRLPGLDGLQVLAQIHRLYPELPVVLFTAHATLQSALDAIRLGASDYLVKPVDPETVLARTRTILAERAVERRRQEIQQQISALQEELEALKQAVVPPPATLSTASPTPADRFLKRGPLTVDLYTQRVMLGGQAVELPPTSFEYLVALARHAPDVVSYEALVVEAQGYETDRPQAQDLAKWHIHTLRQALEPEPDRPRYILNVRGMGYRLVVD
ncbi:MAG: response regulator transcription factor [Chloroflexi bacterium]|nr:response regulator transcription factor [Chloroflexota bacterium]MCI0579080.1 response regulator transcription factor [Chloroflexota bacterium]MCI0644065.1 response regulator transcription factor [Chloroflexota bacterium]MCI0727881.1 response regulator transcription factor [Chloroflexota bacterium]